MKIENHKKIIVASVLAAGAVAGGAAIFQTVSAANKNHESGEFDIRPERPELSEEEKAKIEAELEGMTEEEREEWLKEHDMGHRGGRHGKPKDMTDEEWEEKKSELENMTEEERRAWFEAYKEEHAGDMQKPEDMTDEEWEAKQAERKEKMKEKFSEMTDEERKAWQENHKKTETEE